MSPKETLALVIVCLSCLTVQSQPSESPQTVWPTQEQVIKALGVLIQVVRNVEVYVNGNELSSVHNEDMLLQGAVNILLLDAKKPPAVEKETQFAALLKFGREISDLHEAADAENQVEAEKRLNVVLMSFSEIRKFYSNSLLSRGESLANKYTCAMHPDIVGNKDDLCPKCGMALDEPLRINLYGSGQTIVTPSTIEGSIQTFGPLTVGAEQTFQIRLRKIIDQSPILLSDLREVHTKKIHLFIIDRSLEDYHHVHPEGTSTAGTYVFSFTPTKPGPYRVWADLRPTQTGLQEYVMTDIPDSSEGEPSIPKPPRLTSEQEGLKFNLSFKGKTIKVGEPVLAKLRITKSSGAPFTQLEPVMGMFAHIAGFHEDYKTVLHMHPKGSKILSPTDRGGPELEFVFYATKPGFYRLFAQIQVAGVSKFAPFDIAVSPASE